MSSIAIYILDDSVYILPYRIIIGISNPEGGCNVNVLHIAIRLLYLLATGFDSLISVFDYSLVGARS